MKVKALAKRRFEDFKKSDECKEMKEETTFPSFQAGYLQCLGDVISAIGEANWEEVVDGNDLIIEVVKALKHRYPECQD